MSLNEPDAEPRLAPVLRMSANVQPRPAPEHPEQGTPPVLVTDLASKTLAVKEGDTFLYTDREGNLDHGGDYGLGLYSRDTRFLSSFRMTINGRDPVLLSSTSERGYMSHVDLTNPDLFEGDVLAVPQQTLNIRRVRAIDGRLFERVRVKNYNSFAVSVDVAFVFGADFADIFEVRGMGRGRRTGGPPTPRPRPACPSARSRRSSSHSRWSPGWGRRSRCPRRTSSTPCTTSGARTRGGGGVRRRSAPPTTRS